MVHKVSIIDYGMGNIWSVLNAFEFMGAKTKVVSSPDEIYKAECLVLPGVGSFKTAMNIIKEKSLDEAIKSSCKKGTKILGICLGMQLLCLSSTEDGFGFRQRIRQPVRVRSATLRKRRATATTATNVGGNRA